MIFKLRLLIILLGFIGQQHSYAVSSSSNFKLIWSGDSSLTNTPMSTDHKILVSTSNSYPSQFAQSSNFLINPIYRFDYTSDLDSDGLTDFEEVDLGTDPNIQDTDQDGLNDGDEVMFDGIYDEGIDTDPLNDDTDGDSIPDGIDLEPLIAQSQQVPFPNMMIVILSVIFYLSTRNLGNKQTNEGYSNV